MTEKSEQNQQVKVERNPFILILNEPCVEMRLYEVLGINPKQWYNLKDKGILPQKGTYGEFLTKVFTHYKEQNEVALAKVESALTKESSKRNYRSSDTESGLPRIVEAEKIQKIKLDKAREEQVHIANLRERGNMVDKKELFEIFSPILSNIASILRNAAEAEPNLQETIDKCFTNLFSLGELLAKQVELDSIRYVTEMLCKEIDLEELIASSDLEL